MAFQFDFPNWGLMFYSTQKKSNFSQGKIIHRLVQPLACRTHVFKKISRVYILSYNNPFLTAFKLCLGGWCRWFPGCITFQALHLLCGFFNLSGDISTSLDRAALNQEPLSFQQSKHLFELDSIVGASCAPVFRSHFCAHQVQRLQNQVLYRAGGGIGYTLFW